MPSSHRNKKIKDSILVLVLSMALIKKEPVMFPYVCRYRLNKICEKQKTTSLSPRCISLLSGRSSVTILPSKNFGNNCSSQSQPSVERLLLRTTETNVSIPLFLFIIILFIKKKRRSLVYHTYHPHLLHISVTTSDPQFNLRINKEYPGFDKVDYSF